MPVPSESHIVNVCKLGLGAATCSFLAYDGQWSCVKGTRFAALIEARRREKSMKAMGDNCSGPPQFTPATAEAAAFAE
jgi:hypothetical protein